MLDGAARSRGAWKRDPIASPSKHRRFGLGRCLDQGFFPNSRSEKFIAMSSPSSCRVGQGGRIAVPGGNCWQTTRANRLAFLVDAAAYFRAFKAAALRAQRSILIVGWDVNSRTLLEYPDQARPDVPNELGPLLDYLARRREGLQVKVLCWDSPMVYALNREWLPHLRFDWFTHPRLCFALDDQHPIGAAHHQKIVVIDNSLAFLGGLDLTVDRLDEPEHRPYDPRRRNSNGTTYEPYHDVQVAVDGRAAQALGEVARDRWRRATGEALRPATIVEDCWPTDLAAELVDVDVAVARTFPPWKGWQEIREVEQLFLDSLAGARESVYIENQYFTSASIAESLLERLTQSDCPEIVLVLPGAPTGWLEKAAMGIRQRYWLARLRNADRQGRFRVYTPVVGEKGEKAVTVHAKVMIVDGRYLRIGSANMNNRSMGLDSECDLAVEDLPGSRTARAIVNLRNKLIAEHLGTSRDRVTAEIQARDSLIEAIDALCASGRSLVPLPDSAPDELDRIVAESELLDPAAPAAPERIADELTCDEREQTILRKALVRLALIIVTLLGLAVLWRWGPLSDFADVGALDAWSQALRSDWMASLAMIAAFVVGGLLMFPVLILIGATGLIFGPFVGMLIAGVGALLSAIVGYGLGVIVGRKTLERMSGGRLHRLSWQLARRGLLSMSLIRLLPLAPFTLINLAAGASHIKFRDFVLGTMLGMAPGMAAIVLFSGQLGEVLRSPDLYNVGALTALLLIIVSVGLWFWRRFARWRADAKSV